MIIASLILINCLTVAFFLTKSSGDDSELSQETVATVGNEDVSRQEWLKEIEGQYGKTVLQNLINQKVIEQMAKKYNIEISDEEVERELAMYKTMYGSTIQEGDDPTWKKQIKHSLLLEELLTKDVEVSEEEMEKFYENNQSLFTVPDAFRISQIVLKTKNEAEQTFKELEQGSNFSVMAMERSLDEFSANQGGELGYISEENDRFPTNVLEEIKTLKPGQWSKPIQIEGGYVIVLLHDTLTGKEYEFNEVKNQIRRQIALEQMETSVSAAAFWDEVGVEWFYGQKEAH